LLWRLADAQHRRPAAGAGRDREHLREPRARRRVDPGQRTDRIEDEQEWCPALGVESSLARPGVEIDAALKGTTEQRAGGARRQTAGGERALGPGADVARPGEPAARLQPRHEDVPAGRIREHLSAFEAKPALEAAAHVDGAARTSR